MAVLCDWLLRYGAAQARGLKDAGIDVTLYYVDRLGEFGGNVHDRDAVLQQAEGAGVKLVKVPMRSPARIPRDVRRLVGDLRRRRIETLVVQSHYDPRFALVSLRFPTALMLHDPKPHSGEAKNLPLVGRVMARFVEATATCVVVHSELLVPQIRPFLRRQRVAVAPHGTDISATPFPPPAGRNILLLGRLFHYKGADDAVAALERVRAVRPEVTLTVAGRGPSADALRLAVPPGVQLIDRYVTDDEVEALMQKATLMLLPYRDATQSGVGLLSIGHGLPCIVTDQGGLPDLVPQSIGSWVVPAGDAQALAESILLHLDHTIAVREAFLRHAAERFSWDAAARTLLAELARLGVIGNASRSESDPGTMND